MRLCCRRDNTSIVMSTTRELEHCTPSPAPPPPPPSISFYLFPYPPISCTLCVMFPSNSCGYHHTRAFGAACCWGVTLPKTISCCAMTTGRQHSTLWQKHVIQTGLLNCIHTCTHTPHPPHVHMYSMFQCSSL